jgi:CRISPR-associated protein Csd1
VILQALNRYYDILIDGGVDIARLGYCTMGATFALNLSSDGRLLDVLPLSREEQRGRKTLTLPRPFEVPAAVKRSVNVAANFLWDNATYVLGISNQDVQKPKYSQERFEAFRNVSTTLRQLRLDFSVRTCVAGDA